VRLISPDRLVSMLSSVLPLLLRIMLPDNGAEAVGRSARNFSMSRPFTSASSENAASSFSHLMEPLLVSSPESSEKPSWSMVTLSGAVETCAIAFVCVYDGT
jgi:hypothetical protein